MMQESDRKKADGNGEQIKIEQQVDILQATFEHYYRMARDHYAVTATTSNLLIVIVGAILILVGLDEQICSSLVDKGSAIAISVIGAFGAIWARKQQERYHYWEFYALKYREELEELMPNRKTTKEYKEEAKKESEDKFGCIFANGVRDSHLWIYLSLIIVIIGFMLYTYAANVDCK